MFSSFFGKKPQPINEDPFPTWIQVRIDYGKGSLDDFYAFEDELTDLVDPTGLGEVDGHEIATDKSDGSYFIVCKDISDIFPLIQSALANTQLVTVTQIMKREADESEYTEIPFK